MAAESNSQQIIETAQKVIKFAENDCIILYKPATPIQSH